MLMLQVEQVHVPLAESDGCWGAVSWVGLEVKYHTNYTYLLPVAEEGRSAV